MAVKFLSPHGRHTSKSNISTVEESFTLTGVELTRSENGETEMILQADQVKSGGMYDFYFKKIDMLLFDKGEESSHIVGGEGAYDTVSQIFTLVEDVSVYVRDEYELRTDALRYILPYKTLKTAADIVFKSKDATIRGGGMRYNLTTGDYRVGGRVVSDLR